MRHHGAQICKQPQRLAQLQQTLLGPDFGIGVGPFRTTDRAQQYGIGPLAQGQSCRRQRQAGGVDCRATQKCRLEFKVVLKTRCHRGQRAHGFSGNLCADAIAGKDCDQRPHLTKAPLQRSRGVRCTAACCAGSQAHRPRSINNGVRTPRWEMTPPGPWAASGTWPANRFRPRRPDAEATIARSARQRQWAAGRSSRNCREKYRRFRC